MAKFSVTGKESGCSDLPWIVMVNGNYQTLYGKTANDVLRRHRAAQDGVELERPSAIMRRGNYFEDAARQWWIDDFGIDVQHPEKGYRSKHCNLAASLDGLLPNLDKLTIEDFEGVTHILSGRYALEIKIPTYKSADPLTIARYLQVQGQIDCADLDGVIIAELPAVNPYWNIAVCKRHKGTIDRIHESVNVFWDLMENDQDYPPATSSEANQMVEGNREKEPVDVSEGYYEGCPLTEDQIIRIIELSEAFENAQAMEEEGKRVMEDSKLDIQRILGPIEKLKLPDKTIHWSTVDIKSKVGEAKISLSEKLSESDMALVKKLAKKITEPTPSRLSRRFQIK